MQRPARRHLHGDLALKLSRKKKWVLVILVPLLFSGAWYYHACYGGNTVIEVSKETTFITEPLGPDGMVDFERYLDDKLSRGVTPGNNILTGIWEAIGTYTYTADNDEESQQKSETARIFFQKIGAEVEIVEVDEDGLRTDGAKAGEPSFVLDYEAWFYANADEELNASEDPVLLSERPTSVPWTKGQYPAIHRFLEHHEERARKILDACQRKASFRPHFSDARFAFEEICELFLLRACRLAGEGKTAKGIEELSIIRSGLKATAQSGGFWNRLYSVATSSSLRRTTSLLLAQGKFSVIEIERHRARLELLAPTALEVAELDNYRVAWISHVIDCLREDYVELDTVGVAPVALFGAEGIDWNQVLRRANATLDGFCHVANSPEALNEYRDELVVIGSWSQTPWEYALAFASIQARSDSVADDISPVFLWGILHDLIQKLEAEHALEEFVILLALHKAKTGSFPANVDELKSKSPLPGDPRTQKPFSYRRTEEGFEISSPGPDGAWSSDPYDHEDDIRFIIPPVFEDYEEEEEGFDDDDAEDL